MSRIVTVDYHQAQVQLTVDPARLLGLWNGPGRDSEPTTGQMRTALEHPVDLPPLVQALVPGDRVVLALDPMIPDAEAVVSQVAQLCQAAGVHSTAVLVEGWSSEADQLAGIPLICHDRNDREQLAYLASTEAGRRIYLNRHLTEADLILPIALLRDDPRFGLEGPWSLIYPRLSDLPPSGGGVGDGESLHVSWLLGSLYHVGLVPGAAGIAQVIVGTPGQVQERGQAAVDQLWHFRIPEPAELVIAGVGRADRPAEPIDLIQGLASSRRLVQPGGKIALFCQWGEPIGQAISALVELASDSPSLSDLQGLEHLPDYPLARAIVETLQHHDLYLYSGLEQDDLEQLTIIPLDRPEQATRLLERCSSYAILSHADRTSVEVGPAEDQSRPQPYDQ